MTKPAQITIFIGQAILKPYRFYLKSKFLADGWVNIFLTYNNQTIGNFDYVRVSIFFENYIKNIGLNYPTALKPTLSEKKIIDGGLHGDHFHFFLSKKLVL